MTEPVFGSAGTSIHAPSPLASLIGRFAHAIDRELPKGDVAALRRLDPHDPSSPTFWKIVGEYLEPAGQLLSQGAAADARERKWAAIVSAMALISGLHQRNVALGTALAQSGYSELRFTRLLHAHGDPLLQLTTGAARYLAAKGQSVDLTDIAHLVLSDGAAHAESIRRGIARRYFAPPQ